uniref:Nodule-specific cysteine-rich peptide L15 n=1 Tax=Lens culinaris TaxID=3864 RepID=A0A7T8IGC8_LENCU|nr:nodule-specific cysteine-rich peptide L15 [Lens culinaris]
MERFINFVYVMFIFLSLLFFTPIVNGIGKKCETDADCPNGLCARGLRPKCYISRCICVE